MRTTLKLSLGEVESKENQKDFFILKLLVKQLNLWIIRRRKGGELLTTKVLLYQQQFPYR